MRTGRGPIVERYADCPCGSGLQAVECCIQFDGTVRKRTPHLAPPAPKTNYSQNGCYLAHTNDCSEGLSGEHYVSQAVLAQLSDTAVAVKGAFWLPPDEEKITGINSLTAKILCARHNGALSGLDTEAALFLRRLREIRIQLGRKSLSRKPILSIISGETLELWVLKLACGLFYSKIAASAGGRQLYTDHVVDDSI